MNTFTLSHCAALKYVVLWMVAMLNTFSAFGLQANPENVTLENDYLLIINTYTSDAPWSNAIIEPVQRTWMTDKRTAIYVEHMNMLMIDDTLKLQKMKIQFFEKYASRAPKAILLLGNPTMILKNDIRQHWNNIPIILCAEKDYIGPNEAYISKRAIRETERIPLAEIANKENLTVIQLKMFLQKNVELLRYMTADLKKIILIGDGRYINQQLDYDMRELLAKTYPEMQYEYFSAADMALEELLQQLGSIEKKTTGVLFSSWFSKSNYAGNVVLTTNSFRAIANVSAPIFALKRCIMDNSGIIGGYLYDEEALVTYLLHTLKRVLAGIPAQNIPFYIPSESIPTFNYIALLQNGFTEADCPPGSLFLERPQTYWERNWEWLIAGGAVIFLSLLFIYFWLYHRIRTLKVINEERQQKLEMQSELARMFEYMPVGYSKGKIIRNDSDEIVDVEIIRMNRKFIQSFIEERALHNERKLSELFKGDFQIFLYFLRLKYIQQKNITYSQYFSTIEKHLSIIITHTEQANHIDIYYLDTTELHLIQQKLNETNYKLAMALDVANIIPWNWDLANHKIACDINHSTILAGEVEFQKNEVQKSIPESQYFANIIKEDRPRIEKAFRDLIEGRKDKVREEYRIFNRTSSSRSIDWVEVCAMVGERDEEKRPQTLIGSLLIITQRKKMEQELIDARDQAQESNRLKSAFLANMSHEIRTPLNAIVGFSEILCKAEEPEEVEERKEYVRIIENNNELLLQLISDILDLSKIEAGTLEFVEAPVEITALIKDIVYSTQMRASTKNLTVSLGEHLPECTISIDKNRLSQVITNLITNAIKFTEEGSITVGYTLQEDNMLHFYVTDTGCGIPLEMQQDIFTRFVKLNNFVQGTGLGLPICQTIIHRLGGQIGVESQPGIGSTFWFTIPYNKVKEVPSFTEQRSLFEVHAHKLTILIAEDNDSNYKLFETILKKEYHILHAWNGQEAVELFKLHQPHIVLMDINMPVMDGYESITEIRKISANVPVLAITAYAYASDEQRILHYGFDGYTSKPINANALRSKINELIQQRLLIL